MERNFWPGARFVDLADLNRQVQVWLDTEANVRIHGATRERPGDRLAVERAHLAPLPGPERLVPFLREDCRVGQDGYVQWHGSWYGVSWALAGQKVQLQPGEDTVEIWAGERRLVVHPRATRPGQRFPAPGQWDGLPMGDGRPRRSPMARQVAAVEVQRRPLDVYEALVGGGMSR